MIELSVFNSFVTLPEHLTLAPAPTLLGPVEPLAAGDLPALVVSLQPAGRLGNGLGERASLVTDGALPIHTEIDLAHPFLPDDPLFPLVTPDRTHLQLPHGGLVRADGSESTLTGADLKVKVAGVAQTLVAANPGANSFTADRLAGILVFGNPLPASGPVAADYFVGQWERRVFQGTGEFRLDVVATDAATVGSLSAAVMDGLASPGASHDFPKLLPIEIGSIGSADPPLATARKRTVRFSFQYELIVDAPDSSGGIIRQIPVQVSLN